MNYATLATYAPSGALASFKNGMTGSFAGITRTTTYNNRFQPVALGATTPTSTVVSFVYDFDSDPGPAVANNGNVAKVTNNVTADRTQSFTRSTRRASGTRSGQAYDELNRIQTAQSQANSGTHCWGLSLRRNLP